MRICIYGAGAMGTSLGALLVRHGVECDFVTRAGRFLDALKLHGAVINGYPALPVRALSPEEMEGKYDVVFLATKQRENAEIARFLSAYLEEDGALVSVQNGLPERELAEVLGADRVYGCALSWGAEKVGDGKVEVTSENGFHFAVGAYGAGARLGEIAAMLSRAGKTETGKLAEIRFAKLAVNASFSTLSAISGLAFYELARTQRPLLHALMQEVFAVARAYGCKKLPLNGHNLFRVFGLFGGALMPIAMKNYKSTRSGMLLDLEAGRRCDVDFVAGACIAAAREKGMRTPLLERAVDLVHGVENGFAEIAPETLEFLTEE